MKTSTNIYIFNLALADALATSTLPFQSAMYLMGTWAFGEVLCKVVIAIDYYNMFTSIFTLTMMSVDRYIAVCHPGKGREAFHMAPYTRYGALLLTRVYPLANRNERVPRANNTHCNISCN